MTNNIEVWLHDPHYCDVCDNLVPEIAAITAELDKDDTLIYICKTCLKQALDLFPS